MLFLVGVVVDVDVGVVVVVVVVVVDVVVAVVVGVAFCLFVFFVFLCIICFVRCCTVWSLIMKLELSPSDVTLVRQALNPIVTGKQIGRAHV